MAIRQSHAKERPFDALLLDGRMPRMSGFELAGHLVKNPGMCGAVLLLLPAPFRKGDETTCRRLGVAARSPSRCAGPNCCPRWRRLSADVCQAGATTRSSRRGGSGRVQSSPRYLRRSCGPAPLDGDRELLQALAGMFFDDCGRLLALCQDAISVRDPQRLLRALNEARVAVAPFAAVPILEAVERLRDLAGRGQWEASCGGLRRGAARIGPAADRRAAGNAEL